MGVELNDLSKAARSGWMWTALEQVSGKLLTLVVGLVLARILEPRAFGLIATVSIFVNVMQQIVNGGISQNVLQKKTVSEDDYVALFWSNFLVSAILATALISLGSTFASVFDEPRLPSVITMMSLAVVVANFGRVQEVWLLRKLKFQKIALIRFLGIAISCLVGVTLAYAGYGVWALLWQQMIMGLIVASLFWINVSWRPSGLPKWVSVKELYKFGTPLFVSQMARGVAGQFINVLIARRYSTTELGYFDRGRLIPMNMSTSLGNVFTRVNVSTLSKVQDEKLELQSAFRNMQKMGLGLCTILMTSLIVFAGEVVEILLGEKWLPSIWYFQTGCIVAWIYLYWTVNADLLRAVGNVKSYFVVGIVCAIMQVSGVLIGGEWGVVGMVNGDLIARCSGLMLLIYCVAKYTLIGYKLQLEILVYMLLWALAVAVPLYAIKSSIHDIWVRSLVGAILAGCLALWHYKKSTKIVAI